jgi:DNA invertase Pin-like site-specific DNA recombinase
MRADHSCHCVRRLEHHPLSRSNRVRRRVRDRPATQHRSAQFTEIESGKRNDRPELEKALAACKRQKAKLVIAKLDRLSRNLAFIATLMDSGVEFIGVDNPHANKLTIHILAAVAQHEREIISARTSAALKAANARGKRLGNPRLSEARRLAALAKKEIADRYSATCCR